MKTPPETIKNIKIDNAQLTGSMHNRACILAKKYGLTRLTISEIIRHEPGVPKRIYMTDEIKQEIIDLYRKSEETVPMLAFQKISEEVGVSYSSVRSVITATETKPMPGKPPKEKLFNYKTPIF